MAFQNFDLPRQALWYKGLGSFAKFCKSAIM